MGPSGYLYDRIGGGLASQVDRWQSLRRLLSGFPVADMEARVCVLQCLLVVLMDFGVFGKFWLD